MLEGDLTTVAVEVDTTVGSAMRELFRQYMSVLILESTRLQERSLYLDPRIRFSEIPEYFASGCACASFQVAVDIFTDLRYNEAEWLSAAAQDNP